MSGRAATEIPTEYREIVNHQVEHHGWRYDATGKGHPKLFPANPANRMIPVPTTPSDHRSLKNFIANVRRSGGTWPPEETK